MPPACLLLSCTVPLLWFPFLQFSPCVFQAIPSLPSLADIHSSLPREAFLPLPAGGLVRISAMRLFLGAHLLLSDANAQCQLHSGTVRLQEGSRQDFYCFRLYLGGLVDWFFPSPCFPPRSLCCCYSHRAARISVHRHTGPYQTAA